MVASWIRPHRRPSLCLCQPSRCILPRSFNLPITKNANKDLTNDNTTNLEIVYGLDPHQITYLVGLPACFEGCLEHRFDVTDGEEHVTIRISVTSLGVLF